MTRDEALTKIKDLLLRRAALEAATPALDAERDEFVAKAMAAGFTGVELYDMADAARNELNARLTS